MSDIKFFRLQAGKAVELQGDDPDLRRPLQRLKETNTLINGNHAVDCGTVALGDRDHVHA